MDGLAEALRNGVVADALIDQTASVTLVQWTGSSRQRQTLPWTQITTYADVLAFADAVAENPRVWRNFSTAIGEALSFSRGVLDETTHCTRQVIDVSGDGINNEGDEPHVQRVALKARNITVNGLAIETDETDLTAYFFENLITGERAFVETAHGFEDYPATILRKLQRETTRVTTNLKEFPDIVQVSAP
jgi:Ca-activated chloride channel family protein